MDIEIIEKVEKYRKLTKEALEKISIMEEIDEEKQKIAEDFLQMAKNYFRDANHFQAEGKLLEALAAFSYAHAWLDAGVRAGVFDAGGDDRLFTLP